MTNQTLITEIEVTDLIQNFQRDDLDPMDYSASRAEIGDRAAEITWDNATNLYECGDDLFDKLTSKRVKPQFKNYLSGFGAWSEDEIESFQDEELVGLLIQLIAGDYRAMTEYDDDENRLYQSSDRWYYSIC